jgi:hypothetical protein
LVRFIFLLEQGFGRLTGELAVFFGGFGHPFEGVIEPDAAGGIPESVEQQGHHHAAAAFADPSFHEIPGDLVVFDLLYRLVQGIQTFRGGHGIGAYAGLE